MIFANDIQYNSTRRDWEVGRADCVATLWSSLKVLCTSPPGYDEHLAQNSESMGEPPTFAGSLLQTEILWYVPCDQLTDSDSEANA